MTDTATRHYYRFDELAGDRSWIDAYWELGYLIIGLTCVFAGVVVAAMRAHHRTQSESRQPRT